MQKLPDKVLELIHKRVQYRPSANDLNFNFIHQEDVFVIADMAYSIGKERAAEAVEAKPAQPTTEPSAPCLHRFVIFKNEVRCADCGAIYDRYIG